MQSALDHRGVAWRGDGVVMAWRCRYLRLDADAFTVGDKGVDVVVVIVVVPAVVGLEAAVAVCKEVVVHVVVRAAIVRVDGFLAVVVGDDNVVFDHIKQLPRLGRADSRAEHVAALSARQARDVDLAVPCVERPCTTRPNTGSHEHRVGLVDLLLGPCWVVAFTDHTHSPAPRPPHPSPPTHTSVGRHVRASTLAMVAALRAEVEDEVAF